MSGRAPKRFACYHRQIRSRLFKKAKSGGERWGQLVTTESSVRTIAFLGNYLPRKCGIATFTSDLLGAVAARHPQSRCFAVAVTAARQLPVPGTPFIVPASCPTCR
jgi:hypothetical protein